MEVLLLIILGFLITVYISTKSSRKNSPSSRKEAVEKFQPFDAENAKQQTTKRILRGRAYIIDGDSIVIKKTQVRLFGVDAPELNHPHGQKAKWALVSLCKGHIINAEVTEQDKHGRTVAKCYLEDGRDISAEMVKSGLAIDWSKFSGGIYRQFEVPNVRKKLWLANARQKGQMHVWEKFEAKQKTL